MDSFAGTCITAIAAIQSGGRVIMVEEDEECYRFASNQLGIIAASMQEQREICLSSNVLTAVCVKCIHSFYASSTNMETEEEGG